MLRLDCDSEFDELCEEDSNLHNHALIVDEANHNDSQSLDEHSHRDCEGRLIEFLILVGV